MKKNLFFLLGCIAFLAVLLGLYAYKNKDNLDETIKESQITTEETTDEISYVNSGQYTLCDKAAEDLKEVRLNTAGTELVLKLTNGNYSVEGYDKVSLNMSNTASLASTFIGLYSDNKISDENREKYGLNSPLATGVAVYGDNSTLTLTLGNMTADKKYYYMESSMMEGIYLVDAIVAGRLLYTINELVDKNLTAIKPNYVSYIEVINKNGDELLMYYDKDKANNNSTFANNGLATLTMEKPLEGATVYPYNLTDTILKTCSALTINSVVEAQPEDYGIYGLDKPNLIVRLRDNSGALELKVGNPADDNNVYVMADNRVSVFTMDNSLFKPFENYTITDFVEKFVALHTRSDIHSAKLESEYGSFTLDFKAEADNKIITDENGSVTDNRIALLNGKPFKENTFSDFYQLLVGLTYDQIGEHTNKTTEPAAVLTYTLISGQVQETKFYTYNDNFYSVGVEGKYDMLVSKQSVKQIVDRAAELSK